MYRYIVIIGLLSSLKSYSQSIDISKNWLVSIDDTLDWASGSFNGKLVGQTGSMPPNSIGVDRGKRIYKVDAKEVHWDQENQIAVRIFSNFHNGGLWGENFNIIFPSENIFHSAEKNISGFPWPKGQKSYEASTKVSISYKEEALKAGGSGVYQVNYTLRKNDTDEKIMGTLIKGEKL